MVWYNLHESNEQRSGIEQALRNHKGKTIFSEVF